jgi:hypothetical protein
MQIVTNILEEGTASISAQIFGNHEKYYVEFQTKEHN